MKILTLALAAALVAPAIVHAATTDTPQVTVRFGDLDLSRTHDAAVLLTRVQAAALESCGASAFSLPDYRDAVQRSACYRNGVAQAVSAVDAPRVTDLYTARAQRPTTLALAAN